MGDSQDLTNMFLVYNDSSGGNKGKEYENIGKNLLEFSDIGIKLHLYNIKKGSPGDKPGFKLLASLVGGRGSLTLDFTGTYKFEGKEKTNPTFTLNFAPYDDDQLSAEVTGEGSDDIGFFQIRGTRTKGASSEVETVALRKKYAGRHQVLYDGDLTWSSDGSASFSGVWMSIQPARIAAIEPAETEDGPGLKITTKEPHNFVDGEPVRFRNITKSQNSDWTTQWYPVKGVTENSFMCVGVDTMMAVQQDSSAEVELVRGDVSLSSKGTWACPMACGEKAVPSKSPYICTKCGVSRTEGLRQHLQNAETRWQESEKKHYDQSPAGALDLSGQVELKTSYADQRQGDEVAVAELRGLINTRTAKESEEKNAGANLPPIRVIVAGGDGTVMWAISEIEAHKIDNQRVAIGVVPFGTGNDFSRALHWGGAAPKRLVGPDFRDMREHLKAWKDAPLRPYDVWRVSVQTKDKGQFKFVHNQKKTVASDGDRKQHNITKVDGNDNMTKYFINYYSFGFDPRVALGMEKKRTKSRTGNLIRYAWEGVKKQTCRAPPAVKEFLQSVQVHKGGSEKEVLFATDGSASTQPNGSPGEIMVLNCLTFAGGRNLWGWSNKKSATKQPLDANLKAAAQDFGDKRLEVLTYTRMGFGMDVALPVCQGRGGRLFHGPGNDEDKLQFEFKDYKTSNGEGRVYMEIDGEAFVCCHPQDVSIQLHKQINVLYNDGTPWFTPAC